MLEWLSPCTFAEGFNYELITSYIIRTNEAITAYVATHADHVSLCARDSAEYIVSNAVSCDITHVRKDGRSPFTFSKNDFDEQSV